MQVQGEFGGLMQGPLRDKKITEKGAEGIDKLAALEMWAERVAASARMNESGKLDTISKEMAVVRKERLEEIMKRCTLEQDRVFLLNLTPQERERVQEILEQVKEDYTCARASLLAATGALQPPQPDVNEQAVKVEVNKPFHQPSLQNSWNDRKKYVICREYLRQFTRLPALKGPPSADELRRMVNTTRETVRQLRTRGVPVEHWDVILVHMLHDRMDPETSKQWELQRASEFPTIEQITNFLTKQADALENVIKKERELEQNTARPSKHVYAFEQSKGASSTKMNEGRGKKIKRRFRCEACGAHHQLYRCPEFLATSIVARQDFVEQHKLCRNCFKRGHEVINCYQGPCTRCPGNVKHNSALCPKRGGLNRQVNGDGASQQGRKRKMELMENSQGLQGISKRTKRESLVGNVAFPRGVYLVFVQNEKQE